MAIVDLIGAADGPGGEGLWDCTHRRFEPVVADLLPRGPAWPRDGEVLRQLVAAEATELSRVDIRSRKLLAELDPSTTFELLPEWEEMYGLPDCPDAAPTTIEGRRAALLAKLLAQGGHDQSLGYWTDLLETLGYILAWVVQGKDVFECGDACNAILFEEEWEHVWELAVPNGDNDAFLECVVDHQALIETLPLVHYYWQPAEGVPVGTESIRGLASTTQGYVAGVGLNSLILYDISGGELSSWDASTPPDLEDYFCICRGGAAGTRLVAAGVGDRVMFSDDGGNKWDPATNDAAITAEVYGISRGPENDDVVVAVGELGATWRSTDAGDTWAAVASPVVVNLQGVTRCTDALVAVGWTRTIIRSTTNGASWTDVSPGGGAETLWGVSAWGATVVAVGASGLILRSADSGSTWAAVTSPTTATLYAVTSSPTGRWTACGASGVILQSDDDGETWALRESPTTEDLYAAATDWPTGQAIVAGNNRTIILE